MDKLIRNHIQNIFGCSSANFDKYPEIWMRNIELFIPQIFNLITINSKYKSNILNINDFSNSDNTLKKLFDYYGSDKGNMYFPFYTKILEKYKYNEKIRLLEIGLGTNNPNLISTMGNNGQYKCGGSLRAFRDYLPNGEIYGADVDSQCLFNENNINTFFVDQLNISTFDKLYLDCKSKKFDIIIDDGLHSIGANLNTIIFSINNINDKGCIIIEDIPITKIKAYQIIDYVLTNNENKYKTSFVTYNDNQGFLYVIEII